MTEKRDLFVSYHTDSSKWMVEKIVPILENRGISCWFAPRDCEEAWADVILNAIDKASIFLVIINEHSMNSEHVMNEINAAFSRYSRSQLALIVFKTDTAQINASTEYYLGRIHMVNGSTPPFDDRIGELVNRIAYTKEHLDSKKELSQSAKFKSTIVTPPLCFIGREKEIEELGASLAEYNKVFVTGMGGVGKSELVRAYLSEHKKNFRSIMLASYTSSLKDIILNDNLVGISNFFRNPPNESDDSYFSRKMKFIEENGGVEDLLVIDNFDTATDEHLDAIMRLPISVIFTTRNFFEDYYNLKLDVIRDEEKLFEIFKKHYPKDMSEEDKKSVKKIFKLVGNHTLTITIVANMMKKQRISPASMIEKLENKVNYHIESQKDINDMIASIFEMTNVSDEEKDVLQNMALVPIFGMSTETFYDYCKLDSYEVIDGLIARNIISHDSAKDFVSLHPVIYRTVRKKISYSDDVCKNYINSVIDILKRAKYVEYTERDNVIEMIDQIIRVLPEASAFYEQFFTTASKALHAFAKHHLTVEKMTAFMQGNLSLHARVDAMTDVADAYRCMEVPEKLFEKACEALELSRGLDPTETKSKKLISELKGRFGWYYNMIGNHEESLKYFKEQLDMVLDTEGETDERIGWAYFNIAVPKKDSGEHTEAIEYFNKSMEYFKKIDLTYAIANTYQRMGYCYNSLGEYETAIKYMIEALELLKQLDGEMHNDTACAKYELSKVYWAHGEYEKAEQLRNEAIACIDKLGYTAISDNWRKEIAALS